MRRWIPALTAAALVTVGFLAWLTLDRSGDCGGERLEALLCPQDEKLINLPDRGMELRTFPNARGAAFTVNATDLLVQDRPVLIDLDGGPASSTGDPVIDRFVLEAQQYVTQKPRNVAVPLELHALVGTTDAVPAAWKAIAPLVSNMFGADLSMSGPLRLFVTDERDSDLSKIDQLLGSYGCVTSEHQRIRQEGRATGATYNLDMCQGKPGLYLDMWQYLHLPGGDDPGGLMQTISDEVMTVWQHQVQPSIRSGTTIPFWAYEGSQTLPYMLYSSARIGQPTHDGISEDCRRVGLAGVAWEGYVAGAQQSCPHQLGSMAMIMLVSRVGVEKVLEYFRADSAIPHEQRFAAMAGEDMEVFGERFEDWLDRRESTGFGRGGTLATDGSEYRELTRRWLAP
jgi:hypothetical protein